MEGNEKPGSMRVSWNWIEYAHRPGADSQFPLAVELVNLPINRRNQVEIPIHRRDLIEEVMRCADLYRGGRREDNNLQAARVFIRARKALRGEL